MMKQETWKAVQSAFDIEIKCLEGLKNRLDMEQFSKAVELLVRAQKIATSGCGHSGIACQHFAHLLCCINRPARFLYPSEAVHGASGFLQKGDVLVLASRGGKTDELMPLMDIAQKKDIPIITVTESIESPMAQKSDVTLRQYVNSETDRFNCQGTTSTTSLCMLFHALQTALIEETDFQLEQFALVHPGGAVGDRLSNIAKYNSMQNDIN